MTRKRFTILILLFFITITPSFSANINYNRLLNGEYYGVDYYSDCYTDFIDLIFDGDGGITFMEIEDSDGGPIESGSRKLSVESDGEINAGLNNRGMVSIDGRFGFMVDFDAIPGLNIFAKKSFGLSNSILNGEYYAITYFCYHTEFSEAIFDGAGGFTYQMLKNSDGIPLQAGSGTYTVASDGQITINDNRGVVSSDGRFVYTVDLKGTPGLDPASAGTPGLVILIKKSSGLNTSILDGDYYSITHSSDGFVSFSEANFNGNGNFTFQQIQKNLSSPLESFSGVYTMESDGQININSNRGLVRGMVSSDGRFVFLVDFTSNPAVDIIAKKFVSVGKTKHKATPWVPLLLLNE